MKSLVLCVLSFIIFYGIESKSHPKPSCGYPPSQWCRSLEIAIECGDLCVMFSSTQSCPDNYYKLAGTTTNKYIQCSNPEEKTPHQVFYSPGESKTVQLSKVQKQCMELNATRPDPEVPQVEISLYYESLCPGCRSFITEQLFPTWVLLKDIMRVHLIPFGNAKELPEENLFSCQHGESECDTNMMQACIISAANHAAFPVIYCMESSADVLNSAKPCLQLHAPFTKWETVESCTKGELGLTLMHRNAINTQALNPAHTHVPWITFNGNYTSEMEDKAMSTLFTLVCSLYKGVKPPVCTGAMKKLDRSFC